MVKQRITKKDIYALYSSIDFITMNTDGAEDRKYFADLTRRLNKIWRILSIKK